MQASDTDSEKVESVIRLLDAKRDLLCKRRIDQLKMCLQLLGVSVIAMCHRRRRPLVANVDDKLVTDEDRDFMNNVASIYSEADAYLFASEAATPVKAEPSVIRCVGDGGSLFSQSAMKQSSSMESLATPPKVKKEVISPKAAPQATHRVKPSMQTWGEQVVKAMGVLCGTEAEQKLVHAGVNTPAASPQKLGQQKDCGGCTGGCQSCCWQDTMHPVGEQSETAP